TLSSYHNISYLRPLITNILLHLDTFFFLFTPPPTTEIYTLSLHDALPICAQYRRCDYRGRERRPLEEDHGRCEGRVLDSERYYQDRKSTRLNSSHDQISYAVFCLKKKKKKQSKNKNCEQEHRKKTIDLYLR